MFKHITPHLRLALMALFTFGGVSPAICQTFTIDGAVTVNKDLTVKGKLILPTANLTPTESCVPGEVSLAGGRQTPEALSLATCQRDGHWAGPKGVMQSATANPDQAPGQADEIRKLKKDVRRLEAIVCGSRPKAPECASVSGR